MSFPTTWTPIAYRPHGILKAVWYPAEGALMTPAMARQLTDRGALLMAQRREVSRWALVIKARGKRNEAIRRFTGLGEDTSR